MIAQAPPWLLDASIWAGACVAILTFAKVLTGFAPVRWIWKRLVHDPVQEGLRSVVQEEVQPMLQEALAELRTNGGSSFRDVVEQNRTDLKEFMAYQHQRNHDLINQGMGNQGRLMRLEQQVATCGQRIEDVAGQVAEVQRLDQEVKHDLAQFNEIDQLGREGRIERRQDG